MTSRTPLRSLLDLAANGGQIPQPGDLAALSLPPDKRAEIERRLLVAARAAATEHGAGRFQPARQIAERTARELDGLVGDWRPESAPLPTDPMALAELVDPSRFHSSPRTRSTEKETYL